MSLIIHEFTQEVRNKTKYGDGQPVSWEAVHKIWWDLLNEYKFDPYED
jgi:hypothetical protein